MEHKIFSRKQFIEIKDCIILKEDIKLETILKNHFYKNTLNVWRNVYKSPIFKIDRNKLEKQQNEIKSLFNKISNTNFLSIKDKIMKICQDNDELIEYSINYIFEIATKQKTYCKQYVKLIEIFINNNEELKSKIEDITSNYKEINSASNIKNSQHLSYDDFCENNKLKVYKQGYSQLIGELFLNNIIGYQIIIDNISYMLTYLDICLKNDDINQELIEELIICVNELIITILNKIKLKDLKNINTYLLVFNKNKKIQKRLIFKIMDLKDKIEPLLNESSRTRFKNRDQ